MNGKPAIKKSERNNPVKKSIRVIKDKQTAAAAKASLEGGELRTKTGRILTDADIETLADEAEQGYDVAHLKRQTSMKRLTQKLARIGLAEVPSEGWIGKCTCGWSSIPYPYGSIKKALDSYEHHNETEHK